MSCLALRKLITQQVHAQQLYENLVLNKAGVTRALVKSADRKDFDLL